MRQHQLGEAGVIIAGRRNGSIIVNTRTAIDNFIGTFRYPSGPERIAAVNAQNSHSLPLLVMKFVRTIPHDRSCEETGPDPALFPSVTDKIQMSEPVLVQKVTPLREVSPEFSPGSRRVARIK
jgi:hypothetical protein